MISINLTPDARTLRHFGFIALFGFGLLALMAWKEWLLFSFGLGAAKIPLVGVFSLLAALSGIFSIVWPRANLATYLGLTLIGYPIGFVLSYLIMGFFFYGMITPIGLVFRLMGRDSMQRRFFPQAKSYWADARPSRPEESYFKQF
jgi:hypothetical protein